ncbi:MAG: hypothetical protein M3Y53_06810 [Thermoproteota archaeon]|nr:hypothetical protein [Thermoproteota archaeon]
MNTFFKEHTVKNEIESWKGFADSLRSKEDRTFQRDVKRILPILYSNKRRTRIIPK